MGKQISILTRVQLCNFLKLNEFRYTKDQGKKWKMTGLAVVWLMLVAVMCFYVGMLAYGYIFIGLDRVLPMYLAAISGLIILFFTILKAESVIFQKKSYEILCSMPVSQTAIVVSRFLSMYLGNLLLSLVVMVSGMIVYGYYLRPGIHFYLFGIVGTLFLPLLPMTIATVFGALITAVSSRMKHKNMVKTILSVLLVFAILGGSSLFTKVEEEFTVEMLQNLSGIVEKLIGRIYPPAVWLGRAMVEGNTLQAVWYFGISIIGFLLMVGILSKNYQKINQRLYSTTARHAYRLNHLKRNSVLETLYKKELKRYFASSIYVTNTIIGPIMMVLLAASTLIIDLEEFGFYFPMTDRLIDLMPFALAATASIMTTTCTSISMEGKEWWIIKSLPVDAKDLFDSKILVNLTIVAPCYLISEVLLMIAFRPGVADMIWLIALPAILIIFACVFGITMNLVFPVFQWENEVTIVKQSASAMIGGLGGCLCIILFALPVLFVRQIPTDIMKGIVGILVMGITFLLYQKNKKVKLQEL